MIDFVIKNKKVDEKDEKLGPLVYSNEVKNNDGAKRTNNLDEEPSSTCKEYLNKISKEKKGSVCNSDQAIGSERIVKKE